MNSNSNNLNNETFDLFNSESNKFQNVIRKNLENFENLSISDFIAIYYQAINVSSVSKLLKENFKEINSEESRLILNQIQNFEKEIDRDFNKNLHRLIMNKLKNSVESYKKKLKEMSLGQKEKTPESLKHQAKIYEDLRKTMSTKEFVEQYDSELNTISSN